MTNPRHTPIVLTIAGSDSGGGAGIQADIKAISATGGYACSVITALTAQNTQGVRAICPVPIEHVESQLDAVFSDLNIAAVKVGMLAESKIIEAVAEKIRQYKPTYVVVDPVMVATSGDLLLERSAISTLKTTLIPLADLITPNLPEGAALTDKPVPETEAAMENLIDDLRSLAPGAILLKGGHLKQTKNSNDLLITPDEAELIPGERVATRNTHGTGCTLSSAIASYLAQGKDLKAAIVCAKDYITRALQNADELNVGQGRGPVNHFFSGHWHVR